MIQKLLYVVIILGILLELSGIVFLLLGSSHPAKKTIVVVSPTPAPTKVIVSPTPGVIEVTLVKGQITAVPKTNITLQLVNTSQANTKCPDCGSSTTIQASSSAGPKTLSYGCGGLAGCVLEQEVDKYVVTIEKQIDQNSIVVALKQKQ